MYRMNYNVIVDTGFRSRSRPDPGYFAGTGDVTSGQLRFQRTLNIFFFKLLNEMSDTVGTGITLKTCISKYGIMECLKLCQTFR